MQLRPYQQKIIDDLRAAMMGGHRAVCVQMPTGAGKTRTAAQMVKTAHAKGKTVYWCCHRTELVEQASQTFIEYEIPHSLIVAGQEMDESKTVHVCSIQTLVRRLHKIPRPDFLIFDEAHHLPSKTWAEVYKTYPKAFVVGLTATPKRLDGKGLGEFFTAMVQGPSIRSLIEAGYLSRYRYFAKKIDLKGVKRSMGDFNKAALAEAMGDSKITGDLITEYNEHCPGSRMLTFCPTVKFAERVAKEFNDAGIPAAMVDGGTEKTLRSMVIENFRKGDIKVLVNVELFCEGLDVPNIEAIGILRPTESLSLHLQILGRGLRAFAGKESAVILDHSSNCFRHGLPDDDRTWTLEMDEERGPKKETVPSLKTCQSCFAAFQPAARRCPFCGSEAVKQERIIRTEKGRLEEVRREEKAAKEKERREKARERGKIKNYADAVAFGEKRGYKPEWSRHYARAKGWEIE